MLTEEQKHQIELQLKEHRHEKYETDVEIHDTFLKGFVVYPNVLRPEMLTSIELAKFLAQNKSLYAGREALDMGCGSGIQGVVMGINGANHVTFSDISKSAVENTKENVQKFCLDRYAVLHGNLFEKTRGKFDVIVFNHPFFAGEPYDEITATMLNEGELLKRFLHEAKNYMEEDASIILPFFHFAGDTNNPALRAPEYGYRFTEKRRLRIQTALHKGGVSIYELIL